MIKNILVIFLVLWGKSALSAGINDDTSYTDSSKKTLSLSSLTECLQPETPPYNAQNGDKVIAEQGGNIPPRFIKSQSSNGTVMIMASTGAVFVASPVEWERNGLGLMGKRLIILESLTSQDGSLDLINRGMEPFFFGENGKIDLSNSPGKIRVFTHDDQDISSHVVGGTLDIYRLVYKQEGQSAVTEDFVPLNLPHMEDILGGILVSSRRITRE